MKTRKFVSFLLCLTMISILLAGALASAAAPKYGADTWVAYNSKYAFYSLDSEENGGMIIRIDSAGKTKTIVSKASVFNLIHCDEKYLYYTGETPEANFKTLAVDKEAEESQYGVIHVDIIRYDIAKGTKKTIKSNIPIQTPDADDKYFYYTTDNKNIYRMKHDGTSATKYKSIDNYYLEPVTLSTGQKISYDWDTDKTTITRKDGTKKTIEGYPIDTEQYLFFWESAGSAEEYIFSLVRYDLDGNKKTKLSALQNINVVSLIYHKGYLYYIDTANEKSVIKRMNMSGKVSTVKDVTKVLQDQYFAGIYFAGDWLMLYDDMENGGYWGEYIARYKIK